MNSSRILVGDAVERLRDLPDGCARTCVTSPPYWRQRDYGASGQIGGEPTPEQYIARLVAVFDEVRRVLADDGTLWVNIGDKWSSGGHGGSFMRERSEAWAHAKDAKGWRSPPPGYKDKDLVGLPFMLAFALRSAGWWWRQMNIWAKPNGMPESVRDRSTVSHEYVLHMARAGDYFYDDEAARIPLAPSSETRLAQNIEAQGGSERANGGAKTNGTMRTVGGEDGAANLRSVWWIAPAQFRDGHFAVMPDRLAELCIVAASAPGDTVLDPFSGAGTTGLVSHRLGRSFVGVELNPKYAAMAKARIEGDAPLLACCEVIP